MPESIVLNPDVRELQIGVRALRTVTIYPLSVRDQLKTSSIVSSAVIAFFNGFEDANAVPDTDFAVFVSGLVSGNLEQVVRMALADEPEDVDVLAEMTNRQLETLITTIYEVNYSFLSELFQRLTTRFQMMKNLRSTKSLQMSATDTVTDLASSLGNLSEKGDLPTNKH